MLRSLVNTAILWLLTLPATSQTITGKVLDAITDSPVSEASIYFNNTSIGVRSGDDGQFMLNTGDITVGDLIVSSVGFRTMVLKLTIAEAVKKRYVFKLERKNNTLENVLVVSDEIRKAYLKKFVSNFLGITEEADKSTITNLKSIYFTANGTNKNSFIALSDEPLEIINKKLGYKIHFQLIQFSLDGKSGASSFHGYTRYESMGDRKAWANNRRAVYYGSSLHFFRSLIKNRLEEEQFEIYFVRADSFNNGNGKFKIIDVATRATARQIVIKDTSDRFFIAAWPDWLMVQYMMEPASKQYLSYKTLVSGNLPIGFKAYLLMSAPYIFINNDGILEDPLSVYYSGYWVYEKAANLLPFDYYPDK